MGLALCAGYLTASADQRWSVSSDLAPSGRLGLEQLYLRAHDATAGDMVLAFVMVNVKVGTDSEVAAYLRSAPNVRAVFDVYGTYDLIVELEAPTLEALYEVLSSSIRKLDNVVSTHTLLAVK